MRVFGGIVGALTAVVILITLFQVMGDRMARIGEILRLNLFSSVQVEGEVDASLPPPVPRTGDFARSGKGGERENTLSITSFEVDVEGNVDTETLAKISRQFEERAAVWSFEGEVPEIREKQVYVRQLPESMNLYLVETVNYRIDDLDLAGLPREVELAIWPDSPLVYEEGLQYFLINPPTDRMEYYYVQNVTQDDSDFYFDAMKNARGIFVRRGDDLLSTSPIGELFLDAMVSQDKTIVAMIDDIDNEYTKELLRKKIEFLPVDHVLDAANLKQDWQSVMEDAQHGLDVNVVLEARGESVAEFKEVLREERAARAAEVEASKTVVIEETITEGEGAPEGSENPDAQEAEEAAN